MALPASIEILPARVISTPDLDRILPAGVRVYLPDLGTDTDDGFPIAARRLREIGCEPVPHLAARRITSKDALHDRLSKLHDAAGISDVLIIGGGLARPAGPFAASLDILETGLLDRFGITRIGIAGHPEGSPDFPDEVAEKALRLKAAFAERTGAEMRLVTQFGFDPETYTGWDKALRAAAVRLPIHAGIAGPTRLRALIGYAAACGVGPSMAVLTKRSRSILRLFKGYDPTPMVRAFEDHLRKTPDSLIAQLHVFPFGGAARSADWLRRIGSWPASA